MVARRARLVLLCGLPGAGKTTLARRLAQEIPAVRLCPDEWLASLGIDLFDEATRDRLEQRFWNHTKELLVHGVSVVLESGFWLRIDRDEKRLGARELGVPVEIHYLDVPMDELWRRVAHRNERGGSGTVPLTRENLDEYAACFQAPEEDELELFDAYHRGRS